MIIGISGKMRSGKSTVAEMIQLMANGNYKICSFADKIKAMVSIATGVDYDEIDDKKNDYLPVEFQYKEIKTYRHLLQKFGTDAVRNNLGENFWINCLFIDLDYTDVIVPDVRFLNEAEAIKKRDGLLIKVVNEHADTLTLTENKHISETEMDKYEDFDIVVENNSSIDELLKQIENIISKHQL